MALGSTIYKVNISLSDFNTHNYKDFNLTIARHPSEDESRMMYRLLAFLYCTHSDLQFTKGLGCTEEPALWQKGYSGEILQWIDLGLPDTKRIRQASGKSLTVKIFTYQQNKAHEWYQKNKSDFQKNKKLEVYHFNVSENGPIDKFVTKSMRLSCIIEEQYMYLSNDHERIAVEVKRLAPMQQWC